MRTMKFWCRVALGTLMVGTAGLAGATDHGFYAVVDGGLALYPGDVDIDISRTPYKVDSVSKHDFAWSFAAGYRINETFAIEAGYSDLGRFASTLVDASGETTAKGKINLAARGKTLAVLAHAPIRNWDLYTKVGAIQSNVNVSADAKLGDQGFSFGGEGSDSYKLFAGIGARYAYSERWALSLQLERYFSMGPGGAFGSADVTTPRVGFAYRF